MTLANFRPTEKIEADKDVLGGGSNVIDTNAYRFKVGMAYLGESKQGAQSLSLTLLHGEAFDKELRQTIYWTSGKEKGQKTFYTKDNVNYPLPGFSLVNNLCLLTLGVEIFDVAPEDKVIKLYNFDTKSEVPTTVPVLVDLIGQEIIAAVFKQTVDKTKETAPGSKVYEPTGETKDENEIDKFFCAKEEHLYKTVLEIQTGEEATFYHDWVKKNSGQTKNKAKGAAGTAGAPKAGGAAASGGTAKPKTSLFGTKPAV